MYSSYTGFSLPGHDWAGGMLNQWNFDDSINRFGFWYTSGDFVTSDSSCVFRARFALTADQETSPNIPTIRLRFTTADFSGSAAHTIVSIASCSYCPPTTGTKEYQMYYYPACAADMGLAFDLLDFTAEEWGTVSLDSVIVEKFDHWLFSGTAEKTYDSESDFSAWEWNPDFMNPGWEGASSGRSGGTVTIRSEGQPQAAFWQSPANDLTYIPDRLYRATFSLSRDPSDDPAMMPWCRIRCFNEDSQMSQEFNINNGNGGIAVPPAYPDSRAYEVYWQTPELPSSPSTAEDGYRVAMDMLNFTPGESGTYILESVVIESSAIPPESAP
jgi:hypothetical protein